MTGGLIKNNLFLWGSLWTMFLLLSMAASLSLGSVNIPLKEVWQVLQSHLAGISQTELPLAADAIVWQIRFPRILLAVLAGMGLSIAGVGFQGVLRNPLAEPYLLGVSTGCSLGAVVVIILGWKVALGIWSLPLFSFLSGMLTLLFVFRIASVGSTMRVESLILAGVIMNAFLSAVLSLLLIINKNEQSDILFWLMGSLSLKGWPMVSTLSPYVLAGIVFLWFYSGVLNLFSLGDSHAFYTGINVGKLRLIILCLSSLTAAACVSICGTVGFVGLIVPHMIRFCHGPDHKSLVPLAALAGGSLVLWGDNLARLVISPEELPLGVITAFLGAPFFIFLLRRRVKGGGP